MYVKNKIKHFMFHKRTVLSVELIYLIKVFTKKILWFTFVSCCVVVQVQLKPRVKGEDRLKEVVLVTSYIMSYIP